MCVTKCSAEAKIFCFYDAQMSHKHHKIQSTSTLLSWGHGDSSGPGCWNGWAETKSVQVEQLGAASAVFSAIQGLPSHRDYRHQESDDACDLHPGHTKLLLLRMQNCQWKWQSYNILLLLLLFLSLSSKFPKPGVLQFMGSWRVGHD